MPTPAITRKLADNQSYARHACLAMRYPPPPTTPCSGMGNMLRSGSETDKSRDQIVSNRLPLSNARGTCLLRSCGNLIHQNTTNWPLGRSTSAEVMPQRLVARQLRQENHCYLACQSMWSISLTLALAPVSATIRSDSATNAVAKL